MFKVRVLTSNSISPNFSQAKAILLSPWLNTPSLYGEAPVYLGTTLNLQPFQKTFGAPQKKPHLLQNHGRLGIAFSISMYLDPIPLSNIVASLPHPLSKRIIFQLVFHQAKSPHSLRETWPSPDGSK